MTGQYGLHDVCIGSPCVIDENGVESVIELRFDPAEQKALEASGPVLRHAYAQPPAVGGSGQLANLDITGTARIRKSFGSRTRKLSAMVEEIRSKSPGTVAVISGVYGGERAFPTSRLPHRQRSQGGFTRTVGATDMPGPSSTMGGSSKVILTGMRCTTLT